MEDTQTNARPEDEEADRWAARLDVPPDIDIDFWVLLVEARIIQLQ